MKLLTSLIAVSELVFSLTSCNKDDEYVPTSKTVALSGANVVPANASPATGSVTYSYNKLARSLNYTITWTGLTGNATAAHIHGQAFKGFVGAVFQDFGTPFPKTAAGTYSGALFIDGYAITEADLLSGKYYVNIHTAANPGGEIRAQLEFQ